jgi:acetolactate synthase-1/2/3 large subunit
VTKAAVEWFAESLRERGVTWISTLCGHGLDPLFHAARQTGIRLVDTRNEQTAAYIAEGYGRLSKQPGVCAVSSGVAVANAMTGLMNAWFDSAPMLLISGSADSDKLGQGAFQDSDHAELVRPITKMSRTITVPERTLEILDESWNQAQSGPVHLMFPMDVQRAPVEESQLTQPATPTSILRTSAEQVQSLTQSLLAATKPLIVAGSEIYYSGEGQDLIAFAEAFSIPVQTPIWDRGLFDQESPAFLGVLGAATGGPALLDNSDCLIIAGEMSDYRIGYRQPAFRLAHGWRQLRDAMIDQGGLAFTSWLAEARRMQLEHRQNVQAMAASQVVGTRTHATHLIETLEQWLPDDAVLVIDGGSIGQWAHQLLTSRRYPGHWLTCGRSGVVGYGLGAAMAARLHYPDRAVVLLSGDGAFTFNATDLESAQRQGLHFTAIVADDQCWGITHSGHLRQFGQGISTQLGAIHFDLLARALGCAGYRVDYLKDLAPRLRDALASRQVTVLHVPITGGNPA